MDFILKNQKSSKKITDGFTIATYTRAKLNIECSRLLGLIFIFRVILA